MTDPIGEILRDVGKELAGKGISMETLSAQALGQAPMSAPDGLALLATTYAPEYAMWFFEFLKGYLATPEAEKPGEMPDLTKLTPALEAAFAALPISAAERQELIDSIVKPFEPAAAAPAPAPEGETPEQMVAALGKKIEEMQKELEAKLEQFKTPDAAEMAKPESPGDAPQAEPSMADLQKALTDLQKTLEAELGKLPPSSY
ncbi:MAG: hypothetical protein ICCCNLDF_03085 [Planctomycetes bacterium]|nr:hypothetical protein [Planctomycetota bacterium]